jgi:hypothetical protein
MHIILQSLPQYHLLGEYCGVVKTGAQLELDAAAACAPDEQLTGFFFKDKTETFTTDELQGAHRVRREPRGTLQRSRPPEPALKSRGSWHLAQKTGIQRPVCRTNRYVQKLVHMEPERKGAHNLQDGKSVFDVAC